jgi:hypothetical protein
MLLKLLIVLLTDQELIHWSKGDKTHLLYTFYDRYLILNSNITICQEQGWIAYNEHQG